MATEAPVLVQVNFDGPSNKLDMRRASSDGRAQIKNESSGGKSPGEPLQNYCKNERGVL